MSRAAAQVAFVGSSAAEPRMRCSMPFVTVEFPSWATGVCVAELGE